MPMSVENPYPPELLDLHLGNLTQAERDALLARIAADPKLAEWNEGLAGVFRALGSLAAQPAPAADLAERIRTRISEAGRPPLIVRPADELTRAAEQAGGPVIRLGSLREIVAVAAMIVLAVGVGLPSLLHMRERGLRMGCSHNLAAVGQGLQQYARRFGASLPFAGWHARNSWRPSNDPNVVTLPNRRHVYPLLRGAYVVPRVFVCPARGDMPMPKGQVRSRNDFIESQNVSYAYYNMAGRRPSLRDNPDLPIMADDNPVFADGVPLFERLGRGDPADRNSRAHGGAGQNILTADGRVKWVSTPHAGIDGDNIWTLNGVETYTGREGPTSPTDAHLLK